MCCRIFAITSSTVNRFWKFFHRWKQQWITYKINKIFSSPLVKHKSLKTLQLPYHSVITKLSTKPFTFLTYLFTALSSSACTNREFTKLRNCWTLRHGPQQSAVDWWERVFAPAYGPDEDIKNSDNMLIEWAVIEAVKQCSKFVECVFQIG